MAMSRIRNRMTANELLVVETQVAELRQRCDAIGELIDGRVPAHVLDRYLKVDRTLHSLLLAVKDQVFDEQRAWR
jgi:hypothetical protein